MISLKDNFLQGEAAGAQDQSNRPGSLVAFLGGGKRPEVGHLSLPLLWPFPSKVSQVLSLIPQRGEDGDNLDNLAHHGWAADVNKPGSLGKNSLWEPEGSFLKHSTMCAQSRG